MFKKIIIGGIALAATGYGIKKLYDTYTEDEINIEDSKNEEKSNESNIYNDIQAKLFKIKNFKEKILCYEFKTLDFEFDNNDFKQRIEYINMFYKKYKDDLEFIISKKDNFEDFDDNEKTLFMKFNELNTILCKLCEEINTNGAYPSFMDMMLKNYIENKILKDI